MSASFADMLEIAEDENMDAPEIDVYVFPSTTVQRRYWLLDQLRPGDTSLNTPIASRLKGKLNLAALEQSLNEIVRRHETLRTTFEMEDGELVQVIAPSMKISLPVIDLRNVPEREREAEAERLTNEEAREPFDLAQGPLFRAELLRLAEEEHVLLITMHHIICDGWSLGLVVKEVGALYEAFSQNLPSALPELSVQYADFACWQQQWLQSAEFEKQLAYWKTQLEGDLPSLELPIDRPRRGGRTSRGAIETLLLPEELTKELKALCQREDITMFMLFLATFKILLHRYTGQEDVLVGSPVANRNQVEVESLIGLFVNVLVLRTDLSANPTFREVLKRVREVALEAFANHDIPFDKLIEELQLDRARRSAPLPQVMFIFQKAFMQPVDLPDLTLTPERSVSPGATFELLLGIVERAEGPRLQLEYNTDLFDANTVTCMLENFKAILERIAANVEERVSDVSLLHRPDRPAEAVEPEDREVGETQAVVLTELFESQLAQSPEAIAAVCDGEQLTYRELNLRAEEVARRLRSHGVGSGVRVGISLERTPETLVGLLAILKTGGAYMPLNPHPSGEHDRLTREMKRANLSVFLASKELAKALPQNGTKVVSLETNLRALDERDQIAGVALASAAISNDGVGLDKKFVAPTDTLERQLTEIWESVFGLQPIGIKDNFFDLGGHSLLAVHLFEQINKLVGKTIPLATLIQSPTIEELASVLREQGGQAPSSSLVALQPEGSKPPFYCIHAWGGHVLFYRDLARRLGSDQPVYGLQAQGLDGKQPRHTRVEDMAAHYIKVIRSFQPVGPYYLGGSSFGGTVAFEIALQLEAQGEKVGLLALFDTWGPGYPKKRPGASRLHNKLQRLFLPVEHHWGSLRMLEPAERWKYFMQKATKARNLLRRRRKQMQKRLYVAVGRPLPEALRRVQTNNSRALEEYKPQAYKGRITLFRATKQPAGTIFDPELGWSELAGGGLDVHVVKGTHGSIVAEPRVKVTVEILKSSMENALAQYEAR